MQPRSIYRAKYQTLEEFGQPTLSYIGAFDVDLLFSVSSTAGDFKHPNPQSFAKVYETCLDGAYSEQSLTGPYYRRYSGRFPLPAVVYGAGFDNVVFNNCIEKLASAVRGNVDLSIDFIQAGSTLSTIRTGLKLVRSASALFEELKSLKSPRAVGSRYLEWIYGVKPTLSTMYELLDKQMTPDFGASTIRVRSGRKELRREVSSGGFFGFEAVYELNTSYRCEMLIVLSNSQNSIQRLSGYTSLNPISIAYESLPFSFVLDWVVNFGGYLRGLETAIIHESRFLYGYVTEGTKTTGTCRVSGSANVSGSKRIASAVGSVAESRKRRTPMGSFPVPRMPPFNPALSAGRLVNAAALLSQAVKSWEGSPRHR
jgi:hypothetical protein